MTRQSWCWPGPKARDVLSGSQPRRLVGEGLPVAVRARVLCRHRTGDVVLGVSFSGELAYEIHVPNISSTRPISRCGAAGEAHGLKLFGAALSEHAA
jgi:dimethylglycine dehydrogenase